MTPGPSAEALMTRIWTVCDRLKGASIWHEIKGFRRDGVTVICHVPGEYWEIDFLEDGRIDVEVFRSVGDLREEDAIDELVAKFGEPREGTATVAEDKQ